MKKLFTLIIVSVSSLVGLSEGLRCYSCAHIEGDKGKDMDQNCAYNVAKILHYQDGVACVIAKGRIGNNTFILRRAFSTVNPRKFNMTENSLRCDEMLMRTSFGLALTIVNGRKVDKLSSCLLCNVKDYCNGGSKVDGLMTPFTIIPFIILTFSSLCLF